jgi:hypothetical protein
MSLSFLPSVVTLLVGLLAGHFVWTHVFFVPVSRSLDADAWLKVQSGQNRVSFPWMPLAFVVAILGGASAAVRAWRDHGSALVSVAGAALTAVTFVLIVVAEVPINNIVLAARSPPPDWQALRDRWTTIGYAKTALMLASYACLLASSRS